MSNESAQMKQNLSVLSTAISLAVNVINEVAPPSAQNEQPVDAPLLEEAVAARIQASLATAVGDSE